MGKKILVFGASGMLGSTLVSFLSLKGLNVYGVYRKNIFKEKIKKNIIIKKLDEKKINSIIEKVMPTLIINCTGIINHKINKKNTNETYYINSILPHLIARKSYRENIKFLHISTDCVFDGLKGNYSEKDLPNATDIYGLSKIVGEVKFPNVTTIRTSIIGHEINSRYGLLEWFLSTKKNNFIFGFSKSYFSGLTTLELSKIIFNYFIKKNFTFSSIVNISGPKISKFNLLRLINKIYSKNILIKSDCSNRIDKSLNSSLFIRKSKYKKKCWSQMIEENKRFNDEYFKK